ncbi:hypothetical protein MR578_10260 [bacterium]|nr:hypothetical protein [bacterium]
MSVIKNLIFSIVFLSSVSSGIRRGRSLYDGNTTIFYQIMQEVSFPFFCQILSKFDNHPGNPWFFACFHGDFLLFHFSFSLPVLPFPAKRSPADFSRAILPIHPIRRGKMSAQVPAQALRDRASGFRDGMKTQKWGCPGPGRIATETGIEKNQ